MKNVLLLLIFITLVACQSEKTPDNETNSTISTTNKNATFSCQLNETPFNATETYAEVFYNKNTDNQVDSVVITAIQDEVTIKSYIYIFDGVGSYPFKNNENNEGIARGELIQKEAASKVFFSTNGTTYISYFNKERNIVSGTFEAEFFYKGKEMPEVFEVTQGSFNNLEIRTYPEELGD